MSKFKGIVSPQGEELIASLLDEKVKWKNPLMERVDGPMFKIFVKTIDNNLLERIPEEWQNPLEPVIEEALKGNWEEAATLISEFINDNVDLPFFDEESEALLFNAIISLMLGLIMGKVESVRAAGV